MKSAELIWDGLPDSGSRAVELRAGLVSIPAGAAISADRTFVEIIVRSWWALATWAVCAVMIWFGLASDNWFLLVLAPFMMAAAIMQTIGKISVLNRDEQIVVFEGVGGVGRRQRAPLASVRSVEYVVKRGRGGSTAWIVIHGGRDLKFGRHLSEEQKRFVIGFLLDATRSA